VSARIWFTSKRDYQPDQAIFAASAFALCADMRKLPKGSKICAGGRHAVPQNTLSELRRHLARLRFVRDQISGRTETPAQARGGSCREGPKAGTRWSA